MAVFTEKHDKKSRNNLMTISRPKQALITPKITRLNNPLLTMVRQFNSLFSSNNRWNAHDL